MSASVTPVQIQAPLVLQYLNVNATAKQPCLQSVPWWWRDKRLGRSMPFFAAVAILGLCGLVLFKCFVRDSKSNLRLTFESNNKVDGKHQFDDPPFGSSNEIKKFAGLPVPTFGSIGEVKGKDFDLGSFVKVGKHLYQAVEGFANKRSNDSIDLCNDTSVYLKKTGKQRRG